MSITLEPPSQLFFERPLTVSASETLTLTNPESEPVAFKVKTTSPKQYCVRPNSGKIEPGEKVEVQILLQPFKEEPPTDFKCKDKFLVQTATIPPEKVDLPTSQLWSSLEQENKSSIKERKLRCVFLPPNDEAKPTKQNETATSPGNSLSEMPVYNTAREVPRIKRQPEDLKNLLTDDLTRPSANSSTVFILLFWG
ncbi:phosphatidylinositol-binding protein scs2, variant 2 [Entomophthora muscae]|uniref:Phosphatidylinositol-binding protein scs2, variant 2 n=1 Tax=Entomophthora muscae TaxID=34485 RepID=A0ACC2SVL9_9FUNG|nr:phosphatidylinositol-binding protein scs2, variant 2 [Entomophthora muscae]